MNEGEQKRKEIFIIVYNEYNIVYNEYNIHCILVIIKLYVYEN